MPSKSPAQHRLMEGIAHGMKPRVGGPSKAVAEEFVKADEAETRRSKPKKASVTSKRAKNNALGAKADRVATISNRTYVDD